MKQIKVHGGLINNWTGEQQQTVRQRDRGKRERTQKITVTNRYNRYIQNGHLIPTYISTRIICQYIPKWKDGTQKVVLGTNCSPKYLTYLATAVK